MNYKDKKTLSFILITICFFLLLFILVKGTSFFDNKTKITGNVKGITKSSSEETDENKNTEINNTEQFIKQILELRKNSNSKNVLRTAELFNKLEKEINNNRTELKIYWIETYDCIYEKCEDNIYLDLIQEHSSNKGYELIYYLIKLNKIWNKTLTVEFSEYLENTNKLITSSNNEKLKKEWNYLINNKKDLNKRIFTLIGLIVN